MKVERLRRFDEFLAIRDEWNSFLDRCAHVYFSMTHEWLSAWWEAFGGDADLWVVLLLEGGCMRGAAPLMLRRDRFRGLTTKNLSLMVNGHTPEGNIILADPEKGAAMYLLEFLRKTQHAWDVLSLRKLPRASKLTTHLEGCLHDQKLSFMRTDSLKSPYIEMSGDWDSYYANRSRKLRKVMRNKLNRMERDGFLSIDRISDVGVIKNALKEVVDVSGKSWKARIGRSIPDDPRVKTFYRKITDVLSEKKMIDIWLMRYRGKAIAFEYQIKFNGIIYPIRADFDEEYRHMSPGVILLSEVIKSSFADRSIRGYNSCGHTYQYLMNWATEVVEYIDLSIFNSGAVSKSLYLTESKIIPVARRARSFFRRSASGAGT
jgi:CelD/BcsL family acetyltransferase involved in cellulose biosynthesis